MFPAFAHLSAYDRHKKLVNDYFALRQGSALSLKRDTSRDKTDYDVIKENHRFLWDEENDAPDSWEARLAKKYYDKLFKEYSICDLMYYKLNKVALRWRTEKEVIVGKGQFECGNKKCQEKEHLRSWEVNFGYVEHGEKKNALVKLRLCPECSEKLNYKTQKREIKRRKSLKRLGTCSQPEQQTPGSSSEPQVTIKVEKEDEDADKSSVPEQSMATESEVWKEGSTKNQEKSREEEFEEYLADLFL
ncbi:protein FRA10AC1 homolog [Cephus cinctus]|uniref:Protein FRA10AC1 homolog n=1 Tax=Cephus cinctus TaxID=211228 RepID=A0AAJ7BPR7_CEPCN|nr:protein FRA10AC1 homolog [Cephus cinctus]